MRQAGSGFFMKRQAEKAEWVQRADIPEINGALTPSAYVQRAYLYKKKHKRLPYWARKNARESWEFLRKYIEEEIEEKRKFMDVHEVAEELSVSRRTVQNWVDAGLLAAKGAVSESGGRRIIPRDIVKDKGRMLRQRAARHRKRKRKDGATGTASSVKKDTIDPYVCISKAKALMAVALDQRLRNAPGSLRSKWQVAELDQHFAAQSNTERVVREARELFCKAAEILGQRVLEDVFDERLSNAVAVLTFMRMCRRDGIPDEIAAKVRHELFG